MMAPTIQCLIMSSGFCLLCQNLFLLYQEIYHYMEGAYNCTGVIGTGDAVIGYGTVPVVKAANLSLCRGQKLAFVGRNGSGKSTILDALVGKLPLMMASFTLCQAVLRHCLNCQHIWRKQKSLILLTYALDHRAMAMLDGLTEPK